MSIETTREALYAQVWERPMTKVAADYRISDVGLKKICDKHRIPVPGRGYWAKKAAGKPVKQTHLRKLSDEAINAVVIHGNIYEKLAPVVREERRRVEETETKPENRVVVSNCTSDLHPLVERAKRKLEKAKPKSDGFVKTNGRSSFDLVVSPASTDRVVKFLGALARAVEDRGHKLLSGETALELSVANEQIPFQILERKDKVAHELTKSELQKIQQWEKRKRLAGPDDWSYSYGDPRRYVPEWDYPPNGQLEFKLGAPMYTGIRRTFADGKRQRLENLLNPIMVEVVTCAAAIKKRREDSERQHREWEEERRLREEAQRIRALEGKRADDLQRHLDLWKKSKEIVEYVSAVQSTLDQADEEPAETTLEWIQWTLDYAQSINPLSAGQPRLVQISDFHQWELR